MNEPFSPEYVRPASADCPNCPCCSAKLCERGRSTVMACLGLTADHRDVVAGCPCSHELTAGTMAWRLGCLRAARRATEQPFPDGVEAVLRAAAAGQPVDPRGAEAAGLVLLHYLAPGQDDGGLVLTEFGRVYLMTLDHPRYQSGLLVVSVDERTRLAEVIVDAWSSETTVTVPADQLLSALGGGAIESLPGVRLVCSTNTWAESAVDVVVTSVQVPKLPEPSPLAAPLPQAGPVPPAAVLLAATPPAPGEPGADVTVELPVLEPPAAPPMPPVPPTPPPTPPLGVPAGVLADPGGVMPLSGRFFRVDGTEGPRV